MKFKLVRASNIYGTKEEQFCKEIEINSIEDLENIKERNLKTPYEFPVVFPPPYDLIINFEYKQIIIHDYYIE